MEQQSLAEDLDLNPHCCRGDDTYGGLFSLTAISLLEAPLRL
jgi:hypothetical protein